MANKNNIRITIDIPTVDHNNYKKCIQDHIPNSLTIQALKELDDKKKHHSVISLDDLFEQLNR